MLKVVMVFMRRPWIATLLLVWAFGWQSASAQSSAIDPLPSWNDGAAKSAIVDFVEAVTTDG